MGLKGGGAGNAWCRACGEREVVRKCHFVRPLLETESDRPGGGGGGGGYGGGESI